MYDASKHPGEKMRGRNKEGEGERGDGEILGKERKSDRQKEREKEEEGDFPYFRSGGNRTQSACRLERNQLYLLLLSPFSFSFIPEQTKRKDNKRAACV